MIETPAKSLYDLEDEENAKPVAATGNKRFKMDPEFYRPPDAEELYNLKNNELLYQSNLFRLQVNELVSEITHSESEQRVFELLVGDLTRALKKMKPVKDLKFAELKAFDEAGIRVPLSDLGRQVLKEGSYSFEPPSDVYPIGSYAHKTSLKTSEVAVIDLAVEVDSGFFNERDYLNYRYFFKRNLYLAHVYMQLMNTKRFTKNVEYYFVADQAAMHKPALCLHMKDENVQVHLHAVPKSGTFKLGRFTPSQSNVRRDFFIKHVNKSLDLDGSQDESHNDPTPGYNFDVLSDLTTRQSNEFINEKFNGSKNVSEAVRLVRLWLTKRDLNKSAGGFDNFTLSMFVAFLLTTKQINALMSSYQIFRMTLLNLADAKWDSTGLSLKSVLPQVENGVNMPTSGDFASHHQVVFVDSTGYLNLAAKMSLETFQRVRHEAKLGLAMLDTDYIDNFNQLFINNLDPQLTFDSLIRITPESDASLFFNVVKNSPLEKLKLLDNFNNSFTIATSMIVRLLKKALDDRLELIFPQQVPKRRWSVKSTPAEQTPPPSILIGFLFNDKFENVLIKGPSSTTPEALAFRQFWGKKSELRRFQDTSICEAVYFECENVAAKRLVYSEIVKYILDLHLSIKEEHIRFVDRQLNSLLTLPAGTIKNYGTGEEKLASVVTAFDEFSRVCKSLRDLPLHINNMHGISSAFRLTDVFAPMSSCFKYDEKSEKMMRVKSDNNKYLPKYPLGPVLAPYVKPIHAFIQLESSGKWPDDLTCIKRLKTAFYIKIVQLLREQCGLSAFSNLDYFDAVYKGYVFRLHVLTMNELLCIKNEINDLGIIQTKESKESIEYEKVFFTVPKLTSCLHGLQQKHPCFSGVSRLAKRWLAAHFLLEYFEEEAVDLICSYLFVHPNGFNAPKSVITGFTRFLDLLTTFDWRNQILPINFNNELKKEELVSIQAQFNENRAALPPIFISTPYDGVHKNSVWTMAKPSIQELCRTVIIAKQSLVKLRACVSNFESTDAFKGVFRPNVSMFDAVINLKAAYCVKAYQQVDICEGTFLPHYHDYDEVDKQQKAFPIVDFDPVACYVRDLRQAYGELALFFHDVYGSTRVYVLWRPESLAGREFKVTDVKYRLIDRVNNRLELNVEAILEDFKLLGSELVESINIKKESSIFKQ